LKLAELNPRWIGRDGVFTDEPSEGCGVAFRCPCKTCAQSDRHHTIAVHFDKPLDGGPSRNPKLDWHRTGDTFETLTLTPSIWDRAAHDGHDWHGYITNGEIVFC
jgi:hypothetical protein